VETDEVSQASGVVMIVTPVQKRDQACRKVSVLTGYVDKACLSGCEPVFCERVKIIRVAHRGV
jgi:hypothetical protein